MRLGKIGAALIMSVALLGIVPQAISTPSSPAAAPSGPQPSVIAAEVFQYGIAGVEVGKPASYYWYSTQEAVASPAWSPDGSRLAILRYTDSGTKTSILILDRNGVVTETHPVEPSWDPDGTTRVNGRGLSWSPNGNELAFACAEKEDYFGAPSIEGICIYDFDADTFRRSYTAGDLRPYSAPFADLDWAPDGERVVFGFERYVPCEDDPTDLECVDSELAVVATDGTGNTAEVITDRDRAQVPDWSPDGTQIVYWTRDDESGPSGVVVMPAPGFSGNHRQVVDLDHSGYSRSSGAPTAPADPTWSPDGSQIAFVTDTNGATSGNPDIFTVDAETGGGLENSSESSYAERNLAWGPPTPGCTIEGTPGKDVLEGTTAGDVICGQGGDDTLKGLGGDDRIIGGAGNDIILGGPGADILLGEDGKDTLTGQTGKDSFDGGAGNDLLKAKDGVKKESVNGGAGSDKCLADRKDNVKECEKP